MNKSILGAISCCLLMLTAGAQTMVIYSPVMPPTPPAPVAALLAPAPKMWETAVPAQPAPIIPDMPPLSGDVQDSQDGDDPMVSKTFSKTFPVGSTDKVILSNKYGSLVIKVWDRKEVKVDIDIKAYSTNNKDAQRLLDGVNIDAGKSGDIVSIKTIMEELRGSYGKNVRNGKVIWRREVKINYVVYMPATNALTASMAYGNLNLDNFSGPTSLKVQYGNLQAGDLRNTNNYISAQYGNVNVQNVRDAEMNVQYAGSVNVNAINDLNLNAQYSTVKITTITGTATIKQQYNKLTIGTVGRLNLKGQYAGVTIGTMKGDATVNMTYETLRIEQVQASVRNLTFTGSYANFQAEFADNFSADLTVGTNYGSFKQGGKVSVRDDGDDRGNYSSSKNYVGKIGKGGGGMISVKTTYGSVTFR